MYIRDLDWDADNIQHIAAHHVEPDEAEDVCYNKNLIERVGGNKHAILGRTTEGRYLFIVVAHKGGGLFRVVTARDVSEAEKRRFDKKK